jgi:hypothetical protein
VAHFKGAPSSPFGDTEEHHDTQENRLHAPRKEHGTSTLRSMTGDRDTVMSGRS